GPPARRRDAGEGSGPPAPAPRARPRPPGGAAGARWRRAGRRFRSPPRPIAPAIPRAAPPGPPGRPPIGAGPTPAAPPRRRRTGWPVTVTGRTGGPRPPRPPARRAATRVVPLAVGPFADGAPPVRPSQPPPRPERPAARRSPTPWPGRRALPRREG